MSDTTPKTEAVDPDVAFARFELAELQESMASLERSLDDRGWDRLLQAGNNELTRDGMRRAGELARLTTIANPLLRRGKNLRCAYVMGQGIGTTARDEKINELVQEHLDDPGNRQALYGAQALNEQEERLFTDGNLFYACWTRPLTGRVSPRQVPPDEIQDIIANPDDMAEPWFYLRGYSRAVLNPESGRVETTQVEEYHPSLNFRPASRPQAIAGKKVVWEAPILHVAVNKPTAEAMWGLGDAYTVLPWVRAYKGFLEDWVKLMKGLAQYAYQMKPDSKSLAAKARAGVDAYQRAGGDAGATMISTGASLEAVPKTNATIDAESGKPLLALIAGGLDLPLTILSADPGSTGARAVAETLDFPTRLGFEARQSVHKEARRQLLGYVIDQAVMAPGGPLQGTLVRDDNRVNVEMAVDRTLDIEFPSLEQVDVTILMDAISQASELPLPTETLVRLALRALGVKDVDELIDEMKDENGNFVDPRETPEAQVGRNVSNGDNPAAALRRQDDAEDPDGTD